jgi:hypothetical protein
MYWTNSNQIMALNLSKVVQVAKERRNIPTVSAVLRDGTILEMVYHPAEVKTEFVIWKDDAWKFESAFAVSEKKRLVPYSPDNNLLKNEVVLLPSEPQEYGSQQELVGEIQAFIHRYVDVGPLFEKMPAIMCF